MLPFLNRNQSWMWALLLSFGIAVYVWGLGGQYIPTNGDELVYIHIARLTAESGHWLPLVSDLPNMRNTKPPLLFWQAIAAGNLPSLAAGNLSSFAAGNLSSLVAGVWSEDGGGHWTLFWLRLPSLVYTLLLTAMVGAGVWRITQERTRALMAACIYLAFFSSFRYGRPYLTSAAESFWLFLPLFALLWFNAGKVLTTAPLQKPHGVVLVGLAWGLGLLYKSFALIAPAAAAFWLAVVLVQPHWRLGALVKTSLSVAASALVALGIFGLWFAIDPDPAAVWKEFVLGENMGKMGDQLGYWHEALYGGGSSLWAQALSYAENAGFLFWVVLGLGALVFKQRTEVATIVRATQARLPHHVLILLAWLLVWWLVFMLPSQRSARYVIPAMPALAIVLALYWERIARGWFVASLTLLGVAALGLGRIGWTLYELGISSPWQAGVFCVFLSAILATCLMGGLRASMSRACSVTASLLLYGAFGLLTAPLDGNSGRYSLEVQANLKNQRIAVPSNFNAQWERFEFLLPGNRITPFDMAQTQQADAPEKLADYLQHYDVVVWLQANPQQTAPPCKTPCTVLASRWVVKERHRRGEITLSNLWQPALWLFSREWIVAGGATRP